jgi:hypothetical protein
LSGLNDLSPARARSGHYAGRIRPEFGETHQIMRSLQLGFSGVDLRLSSLLALRRNVKIRPRRPALFQERLLAFEMIARLGQLSLGRYKTCLRLPQGIHFVLRLKARHQLPGDQPISDVGVGLKKAA